METITNEIFYDELIKALKSDKKVFNLKDVSIKGDIRIGEIYERIKDDDKLKHLILSEGNETTVYLDVDIGMGGVVFENDVDFRHLDDNTICVKFKKVEFKNCIFKGGANFTKSIFEENANFKNSVFKEDVDFTESNFKGKVDFTESNFKGKVDFTESNFKGKADFKYSTFEQYARFYDSTFERDANFKDSTFERDVNFEKSTFKENADFEYPNFKGKVNFIKSKFEGKVMFNESTFEGNVYFDEVIFNNVYFSHSIFNTIASFLDISYILLSFKKCIFESTTYFKNNKKEKQIPAFFNLINFKSANNTTFTDFSLSTTSFILTDMKDITIISDISKNEKIFDEMLLEITEKLEEIRFDEKLLEITPKEKLEEIRFDELKKKLKENMKKNESLSKLFSDEKILSDDFIEKIIDISPYLRYETVLKEYRDIRKSFEKHRTYSEASKLFIHEMNLIKDKSDSRSKKIIFTLYEVISRYGESMKQPILRSIFFIILLPIIAISITYLLNHISIYSINHVSILYVDTLGQVLRAFFQLRMYPPENVSFITHWEWIIRVVSLILLSNIILTFGKQLKRR